MQDGKNQCYMQGVCDTLHFICEVMVLPFVHHPRMHRYTEHDKGHGTLLVSLCSVLMECGRVDYLFLLSVKYSSCASSCFAFSCSGRLGGTIRIANWVYGYLGIVGWGKCRGKHSQGLIRVVVRIWGLRYVELGCVSMMLFI